MLKKMPIKH